MVSQSLTRLKTWFWGCTTLAVKKLTRKVMAVYLVAFGEIHKALQAKTVELQSKIQLRITEKVVNERARPKIKLIE